MIFLVCKGFNSRGLRRDLLHLELLLQQPDLRRLDVLGHLAVAHLQGWARRWWVVGGWVGGWVGLAKLL